MKEIASAVTALLAFLIPLGIYCMLLAFINRRNRPLMVRGTWDAIGLLGAMSGFLLWTLPMLLDEFCRLVMDAVEAPYFYSGLWIIYLLFLAFFSVFMVALRVSKTTIYNVDTKVFPTLLAQAVAKIGMSMETKHGRVILTPMKKDAATENAVAEKPTFVLPVSNDRKFAELTVENFPSMCHVTLHWHQGESYLRRQIEEELEQSLDLAAPQENAAASWFYSISGLIFGVLFMVVAMILLLILFPKH